MNEYHVRPEGLPPTNGYSHAVIFSGRLIAVSGQVPMSADGQVIAPDDVEGQFRQVFTNLGLALAAAGARFEHIVKLTIFLTHLEDLAVFRQIRDEYLDMQSPPASTLVRVDGLTNPGFRVEIEALAAI